MKKSDKTKTFSDSNKTTFYGDAEKRTKETVHHIKVGNNIILNDTDYKIIEIISETTGEAIIYKIEDSDQNTYAFKLYYEFNDPENEPNNEALSRIKNIQDDDILRLYDFGTDINKYKEKYCFEILQYADGLDLLDIENLKEKYDPDFIVKEVIPQIFKGIIRLHENRIYHCDLKPQNVFFLDSEQKEIVIGDYGSAKTFEFDAEKKSRKTTTVKGTDFYLPPEQARGFISGKNDYYSFGMILLHLFYPEKILLNVNEPKSLSHSKLKQIIERQFEAKPIIDFNPKFKRINSLIEGLTLVDFNLRWGKEQVNQWIKGKQIEVNYRKPAQTQISTKNELIVGNNKIISVYDLRDYILNEKNWYTDLIENEKTSSDLKEWILNIYNGDRIKRSVFNRMIKLYSQDGIDFLAVAIIRFFIPEHPVSIGLKLFNFAESDDILKPSALAFSHLIFDLWDNSSKKDIKQFIFNYEFALRQSKNKTDSDRVLQILYTSLSVNKKYEHDFKDYKVHAYTKTDKNSRKDIIEYLAELLVSDIEITEISIGKEYSLKYNLIKSTFNYFQSIGIDNINPHKSIENQSIKLRKVDSYRSFDDFIDKTYNFLIKDIISKHNISNDLSLTSQKKLKETLKNTFNKIIINIENEISNLHNSYTKEILRIKGLCIDISNHNNFIKNIRFDSAPKIYEDILILKSELEKVITVDEMLKECKNRASKSNIFIPDLKNAEKLISTDIYENIKKAEQVLTEIAFKLPFNIKDIKKHIEISYKKLKRHKAIKLKSGVRSLAVSSDGKYIIAAGYHSIMILDMNLKTIKTHGEIYIELNRVAVSRDRKYIAYTDWEKESAFLRNFSSGKEIHTFPSGKDFAYGVAFSPDGKYLAVSGHRTLFWNIKKRKIEKVTDAPIEVSFHSEKNFFASIGKGKTLYTNSDTWESSLISETPIRGRYEVCLSPNGKFIATGDNDNSISVYNVEKKELIYNLPRPEFIHNEDDENICFSPDEQLLAAAPERGKVKFWSIETGEPILTLTGFESTCRIVFHPGNEYIVITSENGLFLVYLNNSFK